MALTVLRASCRKPALIPVRIRVSANTRAAPKTAMPNCRRRYCRSRSVIVHMLSDDSTAPAWVESSSGPALGEAHSEARAAEVRRRVDRHVGAVVVRLLGDKREAEAGAGSIVAP